MRLTILFDSPYWIGLLEDERDGCLFVARHIFGAEPSDQLVYEFVLHEATALFARITIGTPIEVSDSRRVGYKRMTRLAHRATEARGLSTQAQTAIKRQMEANNQASQKRRREEHDADRKRKREIERRKAKDKHRGH